MGYPVPNPRVISTTEEKPFEFYLGKAGEDLLFEIFAFYLQKVAYEWVTDYTMFHDNYLPPKQTTIFAGTEELLACLRFSDNFNRVSPETFQKLINVLPKSSWYVHPTYPLSVSQIPS